MLHRSMYSRIGISEERHLSQRGHVLGSTPEAQSEAEASVHEKHLWTFQRSESCKNLEASESITHHNTSFSKCFSLEHKPWRNSSAKIKIIFMLV